jgi:hypothetical protein
MRLLTVLLGMLILTGCTSPQTYWRNNNSGANWGTDLYECTRAHTTTIISGGGTGLVGAVSAGEVGSSRTDYAMRDLCLQSRGWYQVAAPTSAPQTAPTPKENCITIYDPSGKPDHKQCNGRAVWE